MIQFGIPNNGISRLHTDRRDRHRLCGLDRNERVGEMVELVKARVCALFCDSYLADVCCGVVDT